MEATLGNTFGAAFIGTTIATILYGITNLQVYLYFQNYRKDWWVLQSTVVLLWTLDTVHLSLTVAAIYHYLINSFGSLRALQSIVWSFKLGIAINVAIIVLVQTLYAVRVWMLGRHYPKIWPIIVAIIVASGYGIGIVLSYKTFTLSVFSDIPNISWVIYAALSCTTGIDLAIAIPMCVYLVRFKSEFSGTNSKIVAIIRMVLISGFLTSACSLATLITYAMLSHTLVYLSIHFLVTKLYVNSYLAMLNARQRIQEKDSSAIAVNVSKVINISASTSLPSTNGDLPFELAENKGGIDLSPLPTYRTGRTPGDKERVDRILMEV